MEETPQASAGSSRRFMDADDRAQLIAINREIAVCATRKDIVGAAAAFQRARSRGWANSHTFSAMINTHVRCGDIDGAMDVFARLRASTIKLDVVSCTTMIKGHCSVGDIGGAVSLLHEMKRRNMAVNIRTINTIIRGCLSTGTNRIGHNIFQCMKSVFGVLPDSSSVEYEVFMLCQGLQIDKVLPMIGRLNNNSKKSVTAVEDGDEAAGSSSSIDMVHSMSAIYGAVAKAAGLRGEWSLARKYAKLCIESIAAETATPSFHADDGDEGDDDEEELIEFDGTEAAGTGTAESDGVDATKKKSSRAGNGKQTAVGGKRAWKDMDAAREQSLTMYREHKRGELRQDMALLESFVARASAASGSAGDLYFFEKILSFDPFNKCLLSRGVSSEEHLPLLLLKNLIEKFGLDCFIQRKLKLPAALTSKSSNILNAVFRLDDVDSVLFVEPSATPSSKRGGKKKIKKKAQAVASSGAAQRPVGTISTILNGEGEGEEGVIQEDSGAESILRGIGKRLTKYVAADGTIDFREVFATPGSTGDGGGVASQLPIKMEICSGSGEWAAQQALSEAGVANWVTLEVKQDRVYQTFLRMVFQDVRNLCAISGDAVQLLPNHIGSSSLNSVFVNHPEPPVQYDGGDSAHKRHRGRGGERDEFGGGGDGSSEIRSEEAYGKHLLTLPFFEELERVLSPGGTVTIVTDNLWYGRLILRSLSTVPHPRGLQSVALPINRSEAEAGNPGCYSVQDELSGLVLYRGRPGKDCGHSSVEASSYFDRLWNRDNQPERYFFLLQKVDAASGLSLRIAPKGNMSRMKNVPDNQPKTFAVVKTGTKIKFED